MAFPTDEERIQAAESELGRAFPPPLRERLLRDNGGDVIVADAPGDDDVWQLHPVWDDSDRKRAGRTANHVVRETQEAREAGLAEDAVAIASDGTGDLIVLVADDDQPQWWDHETGDLEPVFVDWS